MSLEISKAFISDIEAIVKDRGVPWATVSRKTGVSYSRLRNLRSGVVEPDLSEFFILGEYCGLEYSKYFPSQQSA